MLTKPRILSFIILNVFFCTLFAELSDYSCDELETLEVYAKNGDISAQFDFAICLIKINRAKEAVDWLEKARQLPIATVNLGHCYYIGIGVKKDEERAMHWYQVGAEQDDKWALYYLAKHHAENKIYKKAIPLYKRAAEQSHISSIIALIRYYENINKDPKQYEYWFNLAKEAGYDDNNRRDPGKW